MLTNVFVAAIAFISLGVGAPLNTNEALKRREIITKPAIEDTFLQVQQGYRAIADHVVYLSSSSPKSIGDVTIDFYRQALIPETPIPVKRGPDYHDAIQFVFCGAETGYVLQQLNAHSLLRQYASYFTAKQKKEVIAIAKNERKRTKPFPAIFATYVPLCKEQIIQNGHLSIESITNTIRVFEGKEPIITPPTSK